MLDVVEHVLPTNLISRQHLCLQLWYVQNMYSPLKAGGGTPSCRLYGWGLDDIRNVQVAANVSAPPFANWPLPSGVRLHGARESDSL